MSRYWYVSDLLHGQYNPSDSESLECFHKGFPMVKGSKLSLMDYLVQHGKDWGLFIPPLHTIDRFYFNRVPITHQAWIPMIQSELAKALQDPKTGLLDHEMAVWHCCMTRA